MLRKNKEVILKTLILFILVRMAHLFVIMSGNPYYLWAGNYLNIIITGLAFITFVNYKAKKSKYLYHYALFTGIILLLSLDIYNKFFAVIDLGPYFVLTTIFALAIYVEKEKEGHFSRIYFIIISLFTVDVYLHIKQFGNFVIAFCLVIFLGLSYLYVLKKN